ncbi:MAG: phosphoribosylaminoimidazolesuccinocarboxamide synthase [Bacteroidales bacterium]|jgi:phosphoribosylaminoimidazole-succinocarboxamide synthase|nr:phosphoribosylaminoimidazolesuccinocarboxamide synthase [Bacteroidales bacterium]HOB78023.1 phosphoribosylaminoimidazolesuccinocarboxamide synthase [Bacteroidales bacterium]HPZ61456.1 phosphoribosylaminoimidazolesuccinocarboxamide synthase [Bacteroidales bacterium]HQD59039.1 phosphoribosylaminoimidazolesuccinocarboxamide synthase [Bacteroidales bacterium]
MNNNDGLKETNFSFPKQKKIYKGKVRDIYQINGLLLMIVTDRISAFDIVLPQPIPYKGQVLNQIAEYFLDTTSDILPNWKIICPHPMCMLGHKAKPFGIEMVIRGYLSGHAWREYKYGKRVLCGQYLPDGLKENDPLPRPIITPTTKAIEGHDEDISPGEIINLGLASKEEYEKLEQYTYALFKRGTEIANQKGLILVDTKYEFGKLGDEIILIDEIHTPDSSRYFYIEGYEQRQKEGLPQKQLSKEFIREWLMEQGFTGQDDEKPPIMPTEVILEVSKRYIKLYEILTGKTFQPINYNKLEEEIYKSVLKYLN